MALRITTGVVALIIVLCIAATVSHIHTAPDRIKQRMETAKAVCAQACGHWIVDSNRRDTICERTKFGWPELVGPSSVRSLARKG